jgi:putative transcriptional regulator
MPIRIFLSRKLGELRMSQADLSRKTGIRQNTINEMYHEMCDRVNLDYLDLICEALECDLSEILAREPGPIKRTKSRSGKGSEE